LQIVEHPAETTPPGPRANLSGRRHREG
jgi:hypothetical protein